ncbi:MAG: hypothetical protein ACLFVS_07395 [Candidatus Acetothermia bacterium]
MTKCFHEVEDNAADCLKKVGHELVTGNYHRYRGEFDVLLLNDDYLSIYPDRAIGRGGQSPPNRGRK